MTDTTIHGHPTADLQNARLVSQRLDGLPIVDHFCDRLGLNRLLDKHLPRRDLRVRLAPATVIGVVVRNLVLGHRPVHALAEWAAPYDPTLLGLADGEAGLRGDDRVGRTLARLFDADRASLLTELTVGMIAEFDVDAAQLHNDSTSITLTGAYEQADGRPRAGKPTLKITWGHNTDHRPDLKQLVWILTDRVRRRRGADRLPDR